ncbi:hypothetical protein LTR56_006307 [Elasticomyces elasticus]|nr:hypothetical protein LTR56_006307 [Elasticomyces elasticus]KAK3663355.1 hypothetical protein LTR22_005762 [Elasticomyces elasticus]KAK4925434.1 hypothetical protein LTR49_007498 [Elasticomyces elasticus]KAK5764529.1 hypothetical protein LTS12_005259 [Elasticomyces elasticus]
MVANGLPGLPTGERAGSEEIAVTTQAKEGQNRRNETPREPPFPFRVIIHRNDDGSLELLEFQDLSEILAEDIVRQCADWPETTTKKSNQSWPEMLKAIKLVPKQCAYNKIETGGTSFWTLDEPGIYACRKCANMCRYCFKQHDGQLYLLPLPEAVDESSDPTERGYYKQSEVEAFSKGTKRDWMKLWSKA